MSQSKISSGDRLTVTSPSGGTTSGAGVLIGTNLFGVAETTSLAGDTVAVQVEGEFTLPSDTGTAYAVGDSLYWDNTNKRVTKTSASNTKVGYATAVKGSAATSASVLLIPQC